MQEKTVQFTRTIAGFVAATDAAEIPYAAYEHAKIAFMDWFAVTIAGKDDPLVDKLIRYAELMGGNEQATILGHGIRKTVSQAALINGSASHALDYDDTLRTFLGHPSVTLFPGLLALAEWREASGKDLLSAYLIGLKVGAVVGAAAGLEHYKAGWHATSTIGYLASAGGCARLLGLDEQQTIHCLGIAGTQASGLKRVFGSMCKPFHAGRCSQGGVMAALLAREGFTSAEDILEGSHGFFHVLRGTGNEKALASLGKSWEAENLAQKYHASCHATHSPIEAALEIVHNQGIDPGHITSIEVRSSQISLDAAGKLAPNTGLEGKFSIPYCVSNAILRGATGMQAFTDGKVGDPAVREFMNKVTVSLDESMEALEAKVTVRTDDGKTYSAFSDILEQIPALETKKVKIADKYADLCGPVLGDEKTKDIAETILALDELANVRDLTERITE
ncbi:MAG: MmgE/PrpD family protein [Desulfomonilaceae bacterium]|nr:MmgE/PrpD family protein [Desulfomonilaceae bacterium]